MHNHLKVAAALATVALATACGQVANGPAAPKRAATVQSKSTISRPGDAKPALPTPAEGDVAVESMWGGSVGAQNANISLSSFSVYATLGQARFDGSIFAHGVSGTLRRRGVPTPAHVNLSGLGQSMSGRVGDLHASVSFSGSWVNGWVGQRSINMNVSPNSMNGTLAGRSAWFSGTGAQQAEGPGLVAAIIVMAAAVE